MNYYIDIIDTTNNTHVTILEHAASNGVVLSHEGKDAKDALSIVGSELRFNMEVEYSSDTDAHYIHLFTGNEQKYKVELKRESDDFKIWQGFLLPDSYSEPYTNGNFFVDFEAVDGLGRLKGKYLPDAYYIDEKNVIDIIAQCLLLTGLQLPLYMSPAIDNSIQKNWHSIYLNTGDFQSKNKKQDAYKILQTLCKDMVSCVFQSLGYWYFEGLNKRNLVTYNVKEYDASGVYVQDIALTRNIKEVKNTALASPVITMVAPYNKISVTHSRGSLRFPDTIAQELNENWAVLSGVIGKVYVTDWIGHNGFYARASVPNYKVNVVNEYAASFDASKFISLKEKIYFTGGEKYKLKITIEILKAATSQADAYFVNTGIWNTNIQYDVLFNTEILYSNRTGDITDEDKIAYNGLTGSLNFEFIAAAEGLLDIKWYQPFGGFNDSGIDSINFTELSIEAIGFQDEDIVEDIIAEDYTTETDIKITHADDASGFSKAFRLAKLKEANVNYDTINVPILYGFTQNGNHYSAVQLDGANLIADNINTTYKGATLLNNVEVVYNYQKGEQMLVKTDVLYASGSFEVRVYLINDYASSRLDWHKWTDSVYAVEQERYIQCVANVVRRMFAVPHPKVDKTLLFPVAFNDIIKWDYIEPSNYFITNSSWNLDDGTSAITMVKAVYQNDAVVNPGENIPPIVDAGECIYIADGVTSVTLNASAFDPDGFIASYLWEKITGDAGEIINSHLEESTMVNNLSGDTYEFKITVEDNDGAIASDTVCVVRVKDYTISFVEIYSDTGDIPGFGGGSYDEKHYQLVISPALPQDFSLTISGEYQIKTDVEDDGDFLASFIMVKNGSEIINELEDDDFSLPSNTTTPLNFNYIQGDAIVFKIRAEAELATPEAISAEALVSVSLNSIIFNVGQGNIIGLPIQEQVQETES